MTSVRFLPVDAESPDCPDRARSLARPGASGRGARRERRPAGRGLGTRRICLDRRRICSPLRSGCSRDGPADGWTGANGPRPTVPCFVNLPAARTWSPAPAGRSAGTLRRREAARAVCSQRPASATPASPAPRSGSTLERRLAIVLLSNRVNPTRDNPRWTPVRADIADLVMTTLFEDAR